MQLINILNEDKMLESLRETIQSYVSIRLRNIDGNKEICNQLNEYLRAESDYDTLLYVRNELFGYLDAESIIKTIVALKP